MKRSNGVTNVLLRGLLVLGGVQIWQLDTIEGLVGRARIADDSGKVDPPPPVAGDCTSLPYWRSDQEATDDPANVLRMHTRCMVTASTRVGGDLRRIWGQDPNGLNAYGDGGNSADVQEIYRYVGNWLAYQQVDAPNVFSPELAQKVLVSGDGRTITITLREGVMWHPAGVTAPRHAWLAGPHELTADDYVFVFENILNPDMAGRFAVVRGALSELVGVDAVDRYTFRLTVSARRHATLSNVLRQGPLPRWLYAYDEDGHSIDKATFPTEFLKHWYNQRAIGTGPYRFGEWKQGQSITLSANDDYWGERPSFGHVLLQLIQDKAGWPRAVQNKELDFAHLLPAQYRTAVLEAPPEGIFGDPHVKSGLNKVFSYFYIGWNRQNPLFADARVRRALTMGIDRQALLDNVYYGLGEVISGPLTPQSECYDRAVAPWPFDPSAAAALLAEAGWADTDHDGTLDKMVGGARTKFAFTMILYGASEEWRTIGNQFAEAYRKLGIEVSLDPEEWATYQQRLKKRDFDAYSGSWSLDYEYDPHGLWHSSTADIPESSNFISFRDPQMDALIDAFEIDFDEQHRRATCFQMHTLLHEDEPYTLLFSRTNPVIWWDWLNDLEFFPANPGRDLRYYSFATSRP